MAENQTYYWLKLKEDFFDDDAIKWLEGKGIEYAYFYLKLCTKALKYDAYMIQRVGKMLIPFDAESLATLTRTNTDTVIVAMELLKKIGLVEITENGELFIEQVKELTGKESKWAKYKRDERKNQTLLDNVQSQSKKCLLEIEKEIDIEIDIEKEKKESQSDSKRTKHKYGEYQNVLLTDEEYLKLKRDIPGYEKYIENLSGYIASKGAKYKSHYATIRNWYSRDSKKQNNNKNNKFIPQNQNNYDFDDYEKNILSN